MEDGGGKNGRCRGSMGGGDRRGEGTRKEIGRKKKRGR